MSTNLTRITIEYDDGRTYAVDVTKEGISNVSACLLSDIATKVKADRNKGDTNDRNSKPDRDRDSGSN